MGQYELARRKEIGATYFLGEKDMLHVWSVVD